jgi:hypothetical protein
MTLSYDIYFSRPVALLSGFDQSLASTGSLYKRQEAAYTKSPTHHNHCVEPPGEGERSTGGSLRYCDGGPVSDGGRYSGGWRMAGGSD